MPICPDNTNTLKEQAIVHVNAQKAVLNRLNNRLDDIESELKTLPPDSNRAKALTEAAAVLRLEVRGEKLNPETGQYEQVKQPGSARVEVMERIYTQRIPRRFTYKNADGEARECDIFGLPTIAELDAAGHKEAARELAVRAISLLNSGDTNRNPLDYLDTNGLEVKDALDRGIEYHHIANNVVVKNDGNVHPMSIGFRSDKKGKVSLNVVPAYHGYNYESGDKENQMNAVQYICLMDAMHSGADPVAHLHYHKFEGDEADFLKSKAVEKAAEKRSESKAKLPKLMAELKVLQERRFKPEEYQQKIEDNIAQLNSQLAPYFNDKGKFKPLPKDSPEAETRETLRKSLNEQTKALEQHNKASTLRQNLSQLDTELQEFRVEKKALSGKITTIKKHRKDGKELTTEQQEILSKFETLTDKINEGRLQQKKAKKALNKEGNIDAQVDAKKQQIKSAVEFSKLSDDVALKLWDESNGFFSFDKGNTESDNHKGFKGAMNKEITKLMAREAIEYLEKNKIDPNEYFQTEYQQNLLNRLGAFTEKFKD